MILLIAARRGDHRVRGYVLPLAVIGAAIALYQYVLGYLPDTSVLGCSIDVSCTERYVWEFGFIDFPLMSFVAFSAIAVLVGMVAGYGADPASVEPASGEERIKR